MGFAEAIGGGVTHDIGDAVFGKDLAILFGGEEAGDDGIHADVVGGPFAGEVFGEVMDGGLGHGVGEDAGEGYEAGHGSDVDNGAGDFVIEEVFSEDLAGEEDGFGVRVHDGLVFFFGDFEEGGGGVGAGAIDEDVDLAGLTEGAFEEGVEAVAVSDVAGDEVTGASVVIDF